MNQREDFLVEILTEEMPPKSLLGLAQAFSQQIQDRLLKAELGYEQTHFFATPRRLAVLVTGLVAATPDQLVDRKGPALNAAFDAEGKPTPACIGFARSCGVLPADLRSVKTPQGEWMSYQQHVPGKSVAELMPLIIEQAIAALPVSKRMRWGDGEAQFVRPVKAIMMLYGEKVIQAMILGCQSGRLTRGHRFHAPDWITIPNASSYESLLEKEGHVIADFAKRRQMIIEQTRAIGHVLISNDELLNEVTGLVEWPVALCGQYEEAYLTLPSEVLISSMQDHQRYFPMVDANHQLLPRFVTISNIDSKDAARVIHGNERVIRARLADAAFFYEADKKESLASRVERLNGIVFQAKLGTLYDKAERMSKLAASIASNMSLNKDDAARAGRLAKADLTTNMVNEFPELQGVMGGYYALHDNESADIATAIKEHYMPRFAGDELPSMPLAQVISLADRLDSLVGMFGTHQIPTGDKDPFGLRRSALGVIRILIEKDISLDLREALLFSADTYTAKLENIEVVQQVLNFIQERLRAWYQDQGITPDVFAAVAAVGITNPLDVHERIKAVQAFKKLSEAETLSVANKRVSNILSKYTDTIDAKAIDPAIFETAAEQALAQQLEAKSVAVTRLYQSGKYDQVLLQLADLRQPIDDFFDQVMVMTEDKRRRENRLLLLAKLRALFLQVADIALLQ